MRAARLGPSSILPPAPPPGTHGDPGLVPGAVVWGLARERLIVLGGPAALCLQAMHPLLAAGVADHSDYRRDTHSRLRNTLQAVLTVTFGDRAQGRAMAGAIGRRHASVRGRLRTSAGPFAAGTAYDATDPELGLWVHATLVYCAIEVERRYLGRFGDRERAAYYDQMRDFAHAFGVTDDVLPATYQDFRRWFAETLATLALTDEARQMGLDVLTPRFAPPLPGAGHLTRVMTGDLLPPSVCAAYGLRRRPVQAAVLRLLIRRLRRLVPDRFAFWPHYRQALARGATPSQLRTRPSGPRRPRTVTGQRAPELLDAGRA